LVGGTKYHIKLLAFHSVHNEHDEIKESYVKLKWESDRFYDHIIPSSKLYKSNKLPPLKITGYKTEDYVLCTF
jgi:hypothetical protein